MWNWKNLTLGDYVKVEFYFKYFLYRLSKRVSYAMTDIIMVLIIVNNEMDQHICTPFRKKSLILSKGYC